MNLFISSKYGLASKHALLKSTAGNFKLVSPQTAPLVLDGQITCCPDGDMYVEMRPDRCRFPLLFIELLGREVEVEATLVDNSKLERNRFLIVDGGIDKILALGNNPQLISTREIMDAEQCTLSFTLLNYVFWRRINPSSEQESYSEESFTCKCFGRDLICARRKDMNSQAESYLKNGAIACLPTAHLSIKQVLRNEVEEVIKEIRLLVDLFCVVKGTRISLGSLKIHQNDNLCQQRFFNPVTSAYNTEARNWGLIDETKPMLALISSCADTAKIVWEKYELRLYVDYLLLCTSQRFAEARIVFAILALEHLTTKYLLAEGLRNSDQLEGMNIVDKLRAANTVWRFIRREYMSDKLRNDVRNPLMHTGAIPTMSPREKLESFLELYTLAILCLLKIIGYKGEYRNPCKNWNWERVPWA